MLPLIAALLVATAVFSGRAVAGTDPQFHFTQPVQDQLSLAGAVGVRLALPADFAAASLQVELDGVPVAGGLSIAGGALAGTIADVPTVRTNSTPKL